MTDLTTQALDALRARFGRDGLGYLRAEKAVAALAELGWLGLPPAMHRRVGPGECACGFDAFKFNEFVWDYGDRLDVHIRAARKGVRR